MTDAAFNLLQLERFPNWYDHLSEVDRAIQQAQDDWTVRREYGWDGDDGGNWGPNPLKPGEDILETNWEEELELPFPEDFNEADRYVYELMTVIGKHQDDPTLMAHAVALCAANYLGNLGEPALGKIRGLLRGSPVLKGFND